MIHKEINKHKPHIFFSYLRNASSRRVKALMKTINSTSFSPRTLHTQLKYIMNGPLFVIKDKNIIHKRATHSCTYSQDTRMRGRYLTKIL